MKPARALVVPPQADLADALAAGLIERHAASLPDLSTVTVLVPGTTAIPYLRRCLARCAGRGLLGPRIQTLAQFAQERGSGAALPAAECRLILVEALRRHRGPFPGQDPWRLAEALFSLFEELSLNAVSLPDDPAAFSAWLAQAYGAQGLAALSREAQIVHTLWRAFLADSDNRSPAAVYVSVLSAAFAALSEAEAVYLAGFDALAGGERAALAAAPERARIELWLHGRTEGRDGAALALLCQQLGAKPELVEAAGTARSLLLDAAYALSVGTPASQASALLITQAEDPEHEARCVDLAVREALLAGHSSLAVVTEDRRLARRLRALLERAGVELVDQVGWALSTSAAAAALNAWLDACERNFHFRPLLDLLKSDFFAADPLVLRALERDLIYAQEVEAGLETYLHRARELPDLRALLERLAGAARLLPALKSTQAAQSWALGLAASLEALGLWEAFQRDEAGRRLLQILRELETALGHRPQQAGWADFRALLDRALERATFLPHNGAGRGGQRPQVRLLTLEQSALLRCEVLILAGATAAQIPGAPPGEPFFNQGVRGELGLAALPQRQALALTRLRRLLEAAPLVQVSYAPDKVGEPALLCPWIEAVESLAASAGVDLRETRLARRAGRAEVEISIPASAPAQRRIRPAPPAPVELLPAAISATAHQTLIDCPYRYFVAAGLGLRAEQAPDEDPDRSDYGKRVHRILEGFTRQVPGLPAPFAATVTAANRGEAQAKLEELAETVFAPDLRSRALAHVWLTEFQGVIPMLLDWLASRVAVKVEAEVEYRRAFGPSHELIGTADRVETLPAGAVAIVDYKTGRVPRAADVDAGEEVQLLHYALLDDAVVSVEYLPLLDGEKPLRIEAGLDGLRAAAGARLAQVLEELRQGAPMPALGDEAACARCDYRGLCRKGDWHD